MEVKGLTYKVVLLVFTIVFIFASSVLCSWARHFTLTVSLFTQEYKWVPVNNHENLTIMLGSYLPWTSIPFRRIVILLLRPDKLSGL